MSDDKIMEMAIKRAEFNGYKYDEYYNKLEYCIGDGLQAVHYLEGYREGYLPDISIYEVIFDHNFAKALFGEEKYYNKCKPNKIHCVSNCIADGFSCFEEYFIKEFGIKKLKELQKNNEVKLDFFEVLKYWEEEYKGFSWQYHLQQMVLEENYLEYIRKYLKEKGLIK